MEKYLTLVLNMKCKITSGQIAPHKAILMLAIIDLIGIGYLQSNIIEMSEMLRMRFVTTWEKFVGENIVFKPDIRNPFIYIANDGFCKSLKSENALMIDDELFNLLNDPNIAAKFRTAIIKTYL